VTFQHLEFERCQLVGRNRRFNILLIRENEKRAVLQLRRLCNLMELLFLFLKT
jgi:hypothetical protein